MTSDEDAPDAEGGAHVPDLLAVVQHDSPVLAALFDPQGVLRHANRAFEDAYKAAVRLLAEPDRPTAIFSANNLMVIGVMKAIRDLGLKCPDDVSVTSFDDFPWADVFQPHLTTIAQPVQAIGEQAAKLVLDRVARLAGSPRRIVLQGRLMVRESCRPFSPRTAVAIA